VITPWATPTLIALAFALGGALYRMLSRAASEAAVCGFSISPNRQRIGRTESYSDTLLIQNHENGRQVPAIRGFPAHNHVAFREGAARLHHQILHAVEKGQL